MIESLLLQTIELILKFSIRIVERNQKVIRILKALGLDKLRDDFDSIYARTLVEYGVDNKSKKLLQIFSEKKVITAFKEQLYNKDNEGEFKKKVEAFLQLGMAYKTIKNLDEEINQFKSKFNEFTNTTRTPKELEMFNKIMALELSNIERTFDYQADQYINRIGDELHKELTEKIKYIDLIGEVRKERKDLIEHSESEIKKSKTEGNVRVHKSYNVEEKYEEIKYDPIDTFITPWLNNDNKNFLLLLGEYGTGKTTLCKHIVCELIKNLLESRETNNIYDEKFRIPILFNLRNFKQELIDDFVISQLNRFGIKEITYADFTERVKNDEFILIFDGFDEMTQKIDIDEKRKNFYEIHKLIDLGKDSKVLLTSRQEYFKSDDELTKVIDDLNNTNSDLIYLLIFSDEQIKNYLETHVANPEKIWQEIKEIAGLEELASRAVLLEFIIKHLPEFLVKKNKGETLKASDIYDICINTEINRKIKEVPHLGKLIPSDKRLQLLQILSVWMFLNDTLSIDIRYIKKELDLKNFFQTELDWEIEKYLNEFLAFTFLIRIGNNLFQISHKSFRDYLVAREFVEEINKNKVVSFAQNKTSPEINNFIIEQNPNKQNLLKLVIESKDLKTENKWQSSNAINILKGVDKKSLKKLDLSSCQFVEVDFSVLDLTKTKLHKTMFRNCKFVNNIFEADIENSDFSECLLTLNDLNLTEIPRKIYELKNLRTLYLESNQLKELPKEIARLKNLRTLYLESNQLKELPKEIAGLKNLQSLNLSSNQLKELPKEIAGLKNLRTLYLESNQLKELPKEIAGLKNLQWLDLSSNQFKELPKEIAGLKNLQELGLSSNQFKELPKEIAGLKNLQSLNLSSNQFKELPKEIAGLKNLQRLGLSSNQFKELPKEIAGLKNLQWLDLNSNQFKELPKEIAGLKNLQWLYLNSNQLKELPKEIAGLKNLRYLRLKDNQLNGEVKASIKKLLPKCKIAF